MSVSGNHANKYPDAVVKATRPGISTFYKHEIDTLIRDEMWKQPKAILNILTKRRTDGVPGYDAPLPELRQIRNYKRNMNTPHNNEYEEVLKRIKDLSTGLEELDEATAFAYGVKMGTGSDNDPLIICFSSKYLLGGIARFSHHYSVFHIDGTYKNIKNRFPVIVYGRSDTNGQLHVVSIAIVSAETTATYTHFYR